MNWKWHKSGHTLPKHTGIYRKLEDHCNKTIWVYVKPLTHLCRVLDEIDEAVEKMLPKMVTLVTQLLWQISYCVACFPNNLWSATRHNTHKAFNLLQEWAIEVTDIGRSYSVFITYELLAHQCSGTTNCWQSFRPSQWHSWVLLSCGL